MMSADNRYHFIKVWCRVLVVHAVLASTAIHAQTPNLEPGLSRQQWHAQLGWETQECPLESPSAPNSGIQVFEFSPKLALIQVECQHLTYQATYFFYLQKGKQIIQQKFRQFESPDVGQLDPYTAPLVTGLPTLKTGANTLFILRKYRGYGDCGQYLEYRLSGGQFSLKQLRVNECAETFPEKSIIPQNWPVRKKR